MIEMFQKVYVTRVFQGRRFKPPRVPREPKWLVRSAWTRVIAVIFNVFAFARLFANCDYKIFLVELYVLEAFVELRFLGEFILFLLFVYSGNRVWKLVLG